MPPTDAPEATDAEPTLLERLRDAIMQGELSPNQRLVENDLAVRYGASRGAVRQALGDLENAGLVARERNRGAWVRPVSFEEAVEITEVRAALEKLCAGKAAVRATERERAELRELGAMMQEAVDLSNIRAYNDASQGVHLRIREIAAQQQAAEVLNHLRYKSVRYQYSITMLPGRPTEGLAEHLAIIEAVASGSPDLAEQTMHDHMLHVLEALERLRSLSPLMGHLSAL
jgi:DNA-binding GntR family transcriptional regulator